MSKNSEFNSRQRLFPVKVLACFFGLLMGFFVFSPTASMQDGDMSGTNLNVMVNGNLYRPTPEPPKSTVRGRVIYADTGRPVRRAGLMMLSAKSFAGGGGSGRENIGITNERGEFEIKNVAEGRYFVSINTPGILSPFSSITDFEGMRTGPNNSEIADIARDFQEIAVNGTTDLDVTIPVRRGAALMGRIAYADGEPAIGVRVEVLRKKDGGYKAIISNLSDIFGAMFGGGNLKTDDRGVFRIAGLPAGDYIVRVVENVSHSEKGNNRGDDEMMVLMGFNPTSMVATYYPNTDDVKKAELIKLEIGQEQPEINITIPDRTFLNLSGTVINKATRQPVKNARISIKSKDDVTSLFSSLGEFGSKNQSDDEGRWNYKELPAGKYTLIVQPPQNYEPIDEKNPQNPQKPKQPKLAQLEKEIVIEAKDLTDLILELGYGGSVSGTISFDNGQMLPQSMTILATEENGKFSEHAYVYAQYSNDGKPILKKTDNFKIEGIPNGKIFLNLGSARQYGAASEEVLYIKSILLNGKDINHTTVEAKEGEELKSVQIILSKDVGKLKGKVLNADKSPVAGAKMSFVLTDKQKWGNFNADLHASTNSDGEFEISGAPGEYYVVFIKDSEPVIEDDKEKSAAQKRREWLEKQAATAQKITLKAKETETASLIFPEK